jgi:hypothetical protein
MLKAQDGGFILRLEKQTLMSDDFREKVRKISRGKVSQSLGKNHLSLNFNR